MDLVDTLRSTGAVREFRDEPVARSVVYDLLDTARFSPSGGNRQCWRVVVVEDPEKRRALRDAYLPGWYEYLAQAQRGLVPFAPVADQAAVTEALSHAASLAATEGKKPGGFAEHLDEVPVLLLLLVDLRYVAAVDHESDHYTLMGGASVYPFAWSILLAARAAGLGGVLTTMVARREDEVRAAFGLAAHHGVAGVLALGRPVTQPTKLRRHTVESFATLDHVDGEPFGR